MTDETGALKNWKVLVPRGGPWGSTVAQALRSRGAIPVVCPMINFAHPKDMDALSAALTRLAAGEFDWLTVTSATTVDVLSSQHAEIPSTTRIAAVGETTAAALTAAGYTVDFTPQGENSAAGLVAELEPILKPASRVLSLRSDIAKPLVQHELDASGHSVEAVIAYRTVGVPVPDSVRNDVMSGKVRAILVTSGSVAQQVHKQLSPLPDATLTIAIGPRTRADAEKVGLAIDGMAAKRSVVSMLDVLERMAEQVTASTGPVDTVQRGHAAFHGLMHHAKHSR